VKTKKILVANGVNLDLLGNREAEHYGSFDLKDLDKNLTAAAKKLEVVFDTKIDLHFFQTNTESDFLAKFQGNWDGALINPGAWTHTSLALGDRLAALKLDFMEVHISNVANREEFRKNSYLAPHAKGVVHGLGFHSYTTALYALLT
jgi:3-dehydroquinate dehydratase-2